MDYEKIYEKYWSSSERHGHTSCDLGALARRATGFLAPGGRVLDVGCGEGWLVCELLSSGIDAMGLDVSPRAVEVANSKAPGRFVCGSVLDMPFKDGQFDLVVSSDCLEHLTPEDVRRALQEIHRVCAGAAFLQVATEQDRDGVYHLTVEKRGWWEQACFAAGFVKHVNYYAELPLPTLNEDGWQIQLPMMRRPGSGLSLCLLESTGPRVDELCYCYQHACEYVRDGDVVGILARDESGRLIVEANSNAAVVVMVTHPASDSAEAFDLLIAVEDVDVDGALLGKLKPGGRLVAHNLAEEHANEYSLLLERKYHLLAGDDAIRWFAETPPPTGVSGREVCVWMRNPHLGCKIPYKEMRWPYHGSSRENIVAFSRDYQNPYLVRGAVTIGERFSDAAGLQKLQVEGMSIYPHDSVDYGAMLCGALYSEKSLRNGFIPASELFEATRAYASLAHPPAHVLRWQVSCLYAAGLLAQSQRDMPLAVEFWLCCMERDVLEYSPLLGTKTLDAAFALVKIHMDRGELGRAKELLVWSLTEAERLVRGDWINVRGVSVTTPLYFGYVELSQVLDKASRAANLLNVLNHGGTYGIRKCGRGYFEKRIYDLEQNLKQVHVALARKHQETRALNANVARLVDECQALDANGQRLAKECQALDANGQRLAKECQALDANGQRLARERERLVQVVNDLRIFFNRAIGDYTSAIECRGHSMPMKIAKFLEILARNPGEGLMKWGRRIAGAVARIARGRPLDPSRGIVPDAKRYWLRMREGYQVIADAVSLPPKADIVLQTRDFLSGGLENVILDQAVYFRSQGLRPLILVLGQLGPAADRAKTLGIDLAVGEYRGEQYSRLLKAVSPRVVFAHHSYVGARECSAAGIPFVQIIHNTYIWTRVYPECKAEIVESINDSAAFIAVSDVVAEFFSAEYGAPMDRIAVIPNGINVERFAFDASKRKEIRERYGIGDDDVLFLASGAIGEQKNYPALVSAMVQAKKTCPRLKFLFVGPVFDEGIMRDIKLAIADGGYTGDFFYGGLVDNIVDYYSAADVFVQSSFYEGCSLTILEALVTGCHVVASRTGTLATTDLGLDPASLVDAQIPLAELTSLRLKERSDCFVAALTTAILHEYRKFPQERMTIPASIRSLMDRACAFGEYDRLLRELSSGAGIAGFKSVAVENWVDKMSESSYADYV